MKLLFTLLATASFALHMQAAGVSKAKTARLGKAMAAVQAAQSYLHTQAENYTLRGFEAYTGHKLSAAEKQSFKLLRKYNRLPPDDMDMRGKRTLGTLSAIFGGAGLLFLFTPIGILGVALGIAGLITGIITVSRARQYDNKPGSGFGAGLAGLITGGLVVVLVLIALAAFASWDW
ncbi:MAG TPA: hypothetical protein PKD90_12955 [Phnomibacter sp.]|nr:hypothetical protein [Phnomibacter sp.]